jgi:crotonobetainyl-CoA:carnitine CoA-transferase CaiB-like acyl-CoA transferase
MRLVKEASKDVNMDHTTLSGVKVLDLSRLLPGPFCSMILADLGAEVIKIEDPLGGDYMRLIPPYKNGAGAAFLSLNRNKKSLGLNLKPDEGKKIFLQLVGRSDVVLESFRPGVMEKLGLGYERLKAEKPTLIYCSISGYGSKGPNAYRSGHDLNYIAQCGILGLTGVANGSPVIPGVQIADIGGGALYAAIGILSGLLKRQLTGSGQYLDISMTDGALSFMIPTLVEFLVEGRSRKRGEELLNGGIPCYNVYETKDGAYYSLAALEPKFWQRFCETVGKPEWALENVVSRNDKLKSEMGILFRQKTRSEWEQIFSGADCCCEPVRNVDEVLDQLHFKSRGTRFTMDSPVYGEIPQLDLPIGEKDSGRKISPPPPLGANTMEILRDLGYNPSAIDELEKKGIIAIHQMK